MKVGIEVNAVNLNLYCRLILRFWGMEVALKVEVEMWSFSNLCCDMVLTH